MTRVRAQAPVVALLLVTAVWGWTFVIVRDAVHGYPVLPFLAIRFGIATLCLTPVVMRSARGVAWGVIPGIALALGYLAQTAGLEYTTASKAGLLTGLFVVLTPLLAVVLWRRAPSAATVVAVVGALAGTAMLVGPGATQHGSQEALGDGLEVLTALAFSVHILLLAQFSPGRDPARLAWGQMLTAAVLFSAMAGEARDFPAPTPSVWLALAVTGVLASAAAFWVQTAVQQRISPSRTAVILTAEPTFAAFFGVVLAGDRFGTVQWTGAALIVAAIGYHEWVAARRGAARSGGSGRDQRGAGIPPV